MSIIRVYKNARGEAFKQFFEHIKKNYPDKEFQRQDMPQVPKAFLAEVERQTAGTHWIDSSPDIAAAEAILIDMCNNGLLKRRDVEVNVYGDMDIFFSLTAEGKRAEIVFG
jgi:hypothetical protein